LANEAEIELFYFPKASFGFACSHSLAMGFILPHPYRSRG